MIHFILGPNNISLFAVIALAWAQWVEGGIANSLYSYGYVYLSP